jgi:hypothetical protein
MITDKDVTGLTIDTCVADGMALIFRLLSRESKINPINVRVWSTFVIALVGTK